MEELYVVVLLVIKMQRKVDFEFVREIFDEAVKVFNIFASIVTESLFQFLIHVQRDVIFFVDPI